VERAAVIGYRSASWLLRTLPAGPTATVLGLGSQGSYLLWPTKRDWSNQNFGHVLGLPPDDPRVRRLALRAYREYGRYLVELMRVPHLPEDEVVALVDTPEADEVRRMFAESGGGIIVTAAAPSIPSSLREQLSPDGGRLVIPVGDRHRQDLLLVRRRGDEWLETNDGPCVFVPLVGAEGFPG
jgi:protein-L-isoaspartate(D-aspartate) O-methyltransferase